MLADEITHSWFEQILLVGELRVWLNLVKKVNPKAYKASQALDYWLSPDSTTNVSITKQDFLRIKTILGAQAIVEEVPDSDEEDNEDSAQSQVVSTAGYMMPQRESSLS